MKNLNLFALLFLTITFIACKDDVTEPTVVDQWIIFQEDTVEEVGYSFKIDGLFFLDITEKSFTGFGEFSYNVKNIEVDSNVISIQFESNNYPGTYGDPDVFFRMEDKNSRGYVEYSGSWEVKNESFRGLLIIGIENTNPNSSDQIVRRFHDDVILQKQ